MLQQNAFLLLAYTSPLWAGNVSWNRLKFQFIEQLGRFIFYYSPFFNCIEEISCLLKHIFCFYKQETWVVWQKLLYLINK